MKSGTFYSDAKLIEVFRTRANVHSEMKNYLTLKDSIWQKINFYYALRNKLVHERSNVGISDSQSEDYRGVVETVLKKMYKLRFD